VSLERNAAGCVGYDEDLVAVSDRLNSWHRQADLGPQPRHHDLFPARLLDLGHDPFVLPSVDERPVDRSLLREDILKSLDEVSTPVL
jgi:hypothetical protein